MGQVFLWAASSVVAADYRAGAEGASTAYQLGQTAAHAAGQYFGFVPSLRLRGLSAMTLFCLKAGADRYAPRSAAVRADQGVVQLQWEAHREYEYVKNPIKVGLSDVFEILTQRGSYDGKGLDSFKKGATSPDGCLQTCRGRKIVVTRLIWLSLAGLLDC